MLRSVDDDSMPNYQELVDLELKNNYFRLKKKNICIRIVT